MSKLHYHVIENTPGYMPDNMDSPAIFTSRREAGRYAADLAGELREEGYEVTGNMRDGYFGEMNAADLGRAIEIMACTEADCGE